MNEPHRKINFGPMIPDMFIRATGVERCRAIRYPFVHEPPLEEELPFFDSAQEMIPPIVLQVRSRALVHPQ